MTGQIVNLNRYRKQRRLAERDQQATANRVRHGATKAERLGAKAERDRAAQRLEGKRLEDDGAAEETSKPPIG